MCFVCKRIEMIKEGTNPYFVKELETGYVVLGDHQQFPGYTIFLCKQHESELFDLEDTFRMKYLEEMSLVAKATKKAFHAEKMNYELLGNGDSHIHFHLFPRRAGDLGSYGKDGLGPVWCLPLEVLYNEANCPTKAELEEMKAALLERLEKE